MHAALGGVREALSIQTNAVSCRYSCTCLLPSWPFRRVRVWRVGIAWGESVTLAHLHTCTPSNVVGRVGLYMPKTGRHRIRGRHLRKLDLIIYMFQEWYQHEINGLELEPQAVCKHLKPKGKAASVFSVVLLLRQSALTWPHLAWPYLLRSPHLCCLWTGLKAVSMCHGQLWLHQNMLQGLYCLVTYVNHEISKSGLFWK